MHEILTDAGLNVSTSLVPEPFGSNLLNPRNGSMQDCGVQVSIVCGIVEQEHRVGLLQLLSLRWAKPHPLISDSGWMSRRPAGG